MPFPMAISGSLLFRTPFGGVPNHYTEQAVNQQENRNEKYEKKHVRMYQAENWLVASKGDSRWQNRLMTQKASRPRKRKDIGKCLLRGRTLHRRGAVLHHLPGDSGRIVLHRFGNHDRGHLDGQQGSRSHDNGA